MRVEEGAQHRNITCVERRKYLFEVSVLTHELRLPTPEPTRTRRHLSAIPQLETFYFSMNAKGPAT